jgi:hypothetical protein
MRILVILLPVFLCCFSSPAQEWKQPHQVQVMTLGVFHFAYPNLDAVKVAEEDQISVLDEPFQSEIISIARALEKFNPTIICVESQPEWQHHTDSLYSLYKSGYLEPRKNEIYQLGFRIAANLDLPGVYCIDDMGRHYDNIPVWYRDSARMADFDNYYRNTPDSVYRIPNPAGKISSIIDELVRKNDPEYIADRLSVYLLNVFKYEEEPGDFLGVDFETGRWYNRNLRIFRNVQRIPQGPDDRILVIMGSEHLNLLNLFFDISKEYEFVSPLPYLEDITR